MASGDWVTKVKRNGGGYSILNISDKESAQALADKFNKDFQTDTYYIEPYKEQDAYSHHREP